jgi:hypothetical protein
MSPFSSLFGGIDTSSPKQLNKMISYFALHFTVMSWVTRHAITTAWRDQAGDRQ